ncbi:D-inositol-3-phosphate glycosyltransferase [uncultured archaeon]|nr:D-inositol-3-phosphate glycosyltransferase [uncultured archaeon]
MRDKTNKMKVLIIAPIVFPISNSLKYAGTERVIASLAEKFSSDPDLGVHSIVAATGDSDIEDIEIIYIYSQSMWIFENFERKIIDTREAMEKHYSFCLDYAIKNKIDLIHDNTGIINSLAYNQRKDEMHIPIIITIHDDVDYETLARYKSWKRVQLENRPVFFIGISKSQKEKFEKMTGIKVFDYVHNGISIEKYPFVEREGKQDYLFWIGKISNKKGTDLAIKVAKAVKRPLIIAGEVHSIDREYYEKEIKSNITRLIGGKNDREREENKKELINRLSKNEKIINDEDVLFIGPVNDFEKGILNSHAYSLLMLNRWEEPFGLVMPEAMVTGTPVIGTKRGSIPEIVLENVTGFTIPIEWIDEENLLLKEEVLIEDAKKALEKIPKIKPLDCHNHVKENFNADKMAEDYIRIYKKILK